MCEGSECQTTSAKPRTLSSHVSEEHTVTARRSTSSGRSIWPLVRERCRAATVVRGCVRRAVRAEYEGPVALPFY
jgi:hypothetical protein